ncbi:hypothetical protein Tco_0046669 [Tanacetum coccineum]
MKVLQFGANHDWSSVSLSLSGLESFECTKSSEKMNEWSILSQGVWVIGSGYFWKSDNEYRRNNDGAIVVALQKMLSRWEAVSLSVKPSRFIQRKKILAFISSRLLAQVRDLWEIESLTSEGEVVTKERVGFFEKQEFTIPNGVRINACTRSANAKHSSIPGNSQGIRRLAWGLRFLGFMKFESTSISRSLSIRFFSCLRLFHDHASKDMEGNWEGFSVLARRLVTLLRNVRVCGGPVTSPEMWLELEAEAWFSCLRSDASTISLRSATSDENSLVEEIRTYLATLP